MIYFVRINRVYSQSQKSEIQQENFNMNKENVAMDPGIKINKLNKSKVKNPAN